jgi:hypothetical protein
LSGDWEAIRILTSNLLRLRGEVDPVDDFDQSRRVQSIRRQVTKRYQSPSGPDKGDIIHQTGVKIYSDLKQITVKKK